MSSLALYCLGSAAVCALVFGPLACVWAKSKSPWRFVLSVTVVWVALSGLPSFWDQAAYPADVAHFFAAMYWIAPFAIGPALALVGFVAGGASRQLLIGVIVAASPLAAPISILFGLYAACSLGDCP
jgi:hypothetical protein